jgi:two-component system sensor histidine kinase/response regulator
LDFSKIEANTLTLDPIVFNLTDTLGDALKALSIPVGQKGLKLACHILPDVPELLVGDAGRLRQLVLNLIGNALKFTESGEIVLKVELESRTPREIGLHFQVTDTGIGIPAVKQQQIFEPFTQADYSSTRKHGGAGLGLAISRRLAEMMGGQIWVESELGHGSTFHFSAKFRSAPSAVADPARTPAELVNISVLVVDSNTTVQRIMLEALSAWGMSVTLVDGGATALAEIDRTLAAGVIYSLLILDLDLPMPMMDGFELAERMRQNPGSAGMKVIALTYAGQRGDALRCKQLGIAGYLLKPIIHSDLLECISKVLSQNENSTSLVTRHSLREARRFPYGLEIQKGVPGYPSEQRR